MAEGENEAGGLRALSNEFRNASDAKILKVTRMIDLLPDRGAADALLEPVRARLATLRPARRMNRTRLLFTPLDPVLVSAAAWRSGDFTIPRSILTPVSTLIFSADDASVPTPPALDEGDEGEITRLGAPLWEAAAARLASVTIPPSWETPDWQKQNGLTVPMVMQLIPVLRLVLKHAVAIRTLPPRKDPACEPALSLLMSEAMRLGPLAWGIMLALLLGVAAPDQVSRIALAMGRATRLSAALQAGVDHAIRDMLDRMETMPLPDPAEPLGAGTLLDRLELIDRVEELRRLENRPAEEQKRIARLRQDVAANNRQMFERALQARLPEIDQPADAGTAPVMTDEAVLAIEAEARQLRSFAQAASRLGDGEEYDRLLQQAAARYARTGAKAGLTRADRMRVTELLVGSEKAIQALGFA